MSNTGSDPPRCRCGFWGSAQTANLCSQCYRDEVKSTAGKETGAPVPELCCSTEKHVEASVVDAEKCEVAEKVEGTKEGSDSVLNEDISKQDVATKGPSTSYLPQNRPVQKNKKKCWDCQAKLELAQRELGKCRCGYVYCQLHRLPEKHRCVFDHKESGRDEARQKMVPAGPKKVGRSFQRMDE